MVCRESGVTKKLVLYWDETKIPAFCSGIEKLSKLEKKYHKVKFHKFFSIEAEVRVLLHYHKKPKKPKQTNMRNIS